MVPRPHRPRHRHGDRRRSPVRSRAGGTRRGQASGPHSGYRSARSGFTVISSTSTRKRWTYGSPGRQPSTDTVSQKRWRPSASPSAIACPRTSTSPGPPSRLVTMCGQQPCYGGKRSICCLHARCDQPPAAHLTESGRVALYHRPSHTHHPGGSDAKSARTLATRSAHNLLITAWSVPNASTDLVVVNYAPHPPAVGGMVAPRYGMPGMGQAGRERADVTPVGCGE